MSSRIRGYGLEDLIYKVSPTLTGWDTDPTDANNIVDHDSSTICQTGVKTISAGYQYGYFEWDLGFDCHFIVTGLGAAGVTAGTGAVYLWVYTAGGWKKAHYGLSSGSSTLPFNSMGDMGSKIRLGITGTAAADINPLIRGFNVWKIA